MTIDSETLIQQLSAERDGVIPRGFAEQVEKDLTGAGKYAISRRIALAYLEMPWSESAEKVGSDRKTAVAMAHVVDLLESHLLAYKSLLDWLSAAHVRMLAALSVREDWQAVIAEGKAQQSASPRLVIDNDREP